MNPDPLDDGQNPDGNLDTGPIPREYVRGLEKQVKQEIPKLQAEVERYKRREAIRATGLELTERQAEALVAVHQGEFSAEQLRQSAIELGFAAKQPEVDPVIQRGYEAMSAAAKGGVAQPPSIDAELEAAKSPTEVMQVLAKHGRPVSMG